MNQFRVIGNPIQHSLSPYFFNNIFKLLNIDAEYSVKKIESNKILPTFIEDARIHLKGFNVTLPYKKSICTLLDKTSSTAKLTQSVNCVKVSDSTLIGHNTDQYGFENLVKVNNVDFKQNNILVLGNGGTAYTVIYSLIQNYQNDIYIWGRNKEKVHNLIRNIYSTSNRIKEYKYIDNKPWIIINCLSFNIDKSSINSILTHLPSTNIELIIDINYSKNLFKDALASMNSKIISGEDMFIFQALKSFDIWFDNQYTQMISYNKMKELIFKK